MGCSGFCKILLNAEMLFLEDLASEAYPSQKNAKIGRCFNFWFCTELPICHIAPWIGRRERKPVASFTSSKTHSHTLEPSGFPWQDHFFLAIHIERVWNAVQPVVHTKKQLKRCIHDPGKLTKNTIKDLTG